MNEIKFWIFSVGISGGYMAYGLQGDRLEPFLASRSSTRDGAERYCKNYAKYRNLKEKIIYN